MKKTFRFLALSLMLLGGTLSSFAGSRPSTSVGPADGVYVGNSPSISSGYVAYKVIGWDTELDAYTVEITGFNNQGKAAKPTSLTILTSFEEDYGMTSYKYYVTKISDASASNHVAFWAQTSLTSLTFTNNGVIDDDDFTIEVGDNAFYGCSKLKTLVLPVNTEIIGAHCFEGSAVENFEIPAGTKIIEANAFYDCQMLNTVTVAEGNVGLTVLPSGVFGNSTLEVLDLTNAEGLTTLDNYPFLYNSSDRNNQLTTVTLPESVNDVNSAFKNCSGLTSIVGLENTAITVFDQDAFEGCSSLPVLNFPVGADGVVMLASDGTDGPFKGCAKLATITFAEGFEGTLGDGTNNIFCDNLAALTKITFNGLFYGTIDDYAFGNTDAKKACSKLATVEFLGAIAADKDEPVPTIGVGAFMNCAALATLTLSGIQTSKDAPAGTITIAENAFAKTGLTSLNFGDVTLASTADVPFVIGANAFGSDKLTAIVIGDITITEGAGNGVTINSNAFYGTKIADFTVGDINTAVAGQFVTFSATTVGKTDAAAKSESLATITFGDFAGKGTVTISAGAFASDKTPYSVEIGDMTSVVKFAAGAFAGKAAGASTYTIGDFDFAAGSTIAAGAFAGSTDSGNANSTVSVGAINTLSGVDWYSFNNVKDLTIDSWNTYGGVSRIAAPVTLTVTGDVTQTMKGDDTDNTTTDVTFGGNVTGANLIQLYGANVRNITFANEGIIAPGAVAASAFEAAADDAILSDELITIIYRCETEGNYNQIFNENAFTTTTDNTPVAVLYTTDWAAQRIFKDVTIYRLSVSASEVAPGEDIEATMVAAKNGNYMYGKLYVPQGNGMYYKIDAKKGTDNKNTVNVFSAHLDGNDIYMKQIDVYEGYYWIDATEAEQVFIVRTSDMEATEVIAEAATAEEIADHLSLYPENQFWFEAADAAKNALNYANDPVPNQQLQNDTPFKNHTIYVMLNPAKQNLAFGKLNQYATTANLPKNAVYVISNTDPQAAGGRLNVIFEGDEDATGINNIQEIKADNDAIYNLQGVRVNATQKGMYIKNGKKYIK